jgi:hypothetical protein
VPEDSCKECIRIVRKECIDRGSIRDNFDSRSPRSKIGLLELGKQCAGQAKPQSCDSERSIERLLLQACTESEEAEHSKCLQSFDKECEQRVLFSKRFRSWKKLRRSKAFKSVERPHRRFRTQKSSRREKRRLRPCRGNS